ncbi:hypothetical protein BDF22DRAFT_736359 [Syncephalis plumigaleata]|nr:hypothetical protein BDF22DRAFT_736359 [Syncephalis plumigaleata]
MVNHPGIANEKDTCGFALPINTENACEYCFNNPNEQCCQRMKNEKVNACTSVKAANVSNQHEKTNITLIICACAAAILIVAGFILWRIRYGKQQGNNQNKPPNQIYRALFSYLPNLEDEMLLEVGDIIEVDQIFSDDWAHGCNYTTGEIGMLPMSFLSLASPGQQYQRAPWPTVDKKPVQGVPYKEESYTTTTDMMTDMSGSQGNEPRRHSSRLPSYIDKTDPSNEQRHTWHMLPAMMEKEQEHQQQHQHLAPQRVTISQHPSLSTIADLI